MTDPNPSHNTKKVRRRATRLTLTLCDQVSQEVFSCPVQPSEMERQQQTLSDWIFPHLQKQHRENQRAIITADISVLYYYYRTP